MTFKVALAGVVLMVWALVGCGSSSDDMGSEAPVGATDDTDLWYERALWPHDGDRLETANFVVYSDSADVDARREVATVAEEAWAEVLDEFSVEPPMLEYPEGQTKIDLLVYRDHDSRDCSACADYGNLVIWSPDHPHKTSGAQYPAVMKHELVHVLHTLLSGNQGQFDTWFIEGLAEAASGGTAGGSIRGLDQLEDLTSTFERTSPIGVERYSQISSPEVGEHFHYPMFQLAVEYLLDDDGLGRSLDDMRALIIDVSQGSTFAAAFEGRMGIGVDEYEARFFDLMDDYLPRHRNPLFAPAWFGILALVVGASVVAVPAIVYRRAGTTEMAEPRRPASIGFHAGMILSSAIVLVVFLLVLFQVGTQYQLNNAALAAGRTRAYWILAGFLAASMAIMSWAAHRWTRRSLLVHLVTPLVLLATVATVVGVMASFSL